jgi:hypothetical protein
MTIGFLGMGAAGFGALVLSPRRATSSLAGERKRSHHNLLIPPILALYPGFPLSSFDRVIA